MPKISVLIPAWRPADLDLGIASVLAQTFSDFELIIGDDSDGSEVEAIVSRWSDPRVSYRRNPRAPKPNSNRDYLCGLAEGKYVKFIKPGDYLYPRSLELLHAAAEAADATLAFHGHHLVNASGVTVGERCATPQGQFLAYPLEFLVGHMIRPRENFIGGPSNILVAADFLRDTPAPFGIDGVSRLRVIEDVALYINVAGAGGSIIGCGFICSAIRDREETSPDSAAYSASLFEWEYLSRWAKDNDHLSADQIEQVLRAIHEEYRPHLGRFPELRRFLAGGTGHEEGSYLTEAFDAALEMGWSSIDARGRGEAIPDDAAPAAVKLNVGCGTDYKPGWINIDNNSDNNIVQLDLNWDLRQPLPFGDNSVDFIFNEHFIEHLTVDEARQALTDFIRVLKPGGVMRIAMPDLADVIHKYLHVALEDDPVVKRFLPGTVRTRAERINIAFRWWGHQWLYDWEELERRLQELGCRKIVRGTWNSSDHSELANLETRPESRLIAEVTKL